MRLLAITFVVSLGITACGGAPSSESHGPVSATAAKTVAATSAPIPSATQSPRPACGVFPADNIWRADVSKLPVSRTSGTIVNSIGADRHVHPDFGAGTWDGAPIGIPVTNVKPGQKAVKVTFEYAGESDKGPYPLPADAKVEGGTGSDGDRHVILYDATACKVFELYAAYRSGSAWRAGSGAVFDLRSNKLRPADWTSADAAGLSIFAGLVRYEEVAAGRITHALRITVPRSRNTYVWPARHAASSSSDPSLPPMGLRLRLKASVNTSTMPHQAKLIAEAMKTYGVIVSDNGSPWYLSGTPDERWNNDALRALKNLQGSNFEVVDTAQLMVDQNSGAVRR